MKRKWLDHFVAQAELTATMSKDHSTKVGAVLVEPSGRTIISTGYNGFCRGINDDEPTRHDRPAKYDWTEHAERNAIYNAARLGHKTEGCILFLNWSPDFLCTDCARAVIQAGIIEVIGPAKRFPGLQDIDYPAAIEMLAEAKVVRGTISG